MSGIEVTLAMAQQLLEPGHQKYLCLYRLSQDHLELFFNAIRRSGRFVFNYSLLIFIIFSRVHRHLVITIMLQEDGIITHQYNILKLASAN